MGHSQHGHMEPWAAFLTCVKMLGQAIAGQATGAATNECRSTCGWMPTSQKTYIADRPGRIEAYLTD